MLVQLERYAPEGVETPEEIRHVAINSTMVYAIVPSERPGACIVRGPDGRGLLVRGTYREVFEHLNGSMPAVPSEHIM